MMQFFLATWLRKLGTVFGLSLLFVLGGLFIDQAYLDHPIGEGSLGVNADEGYNMPATTEITVTADGIDSLKITLKSEKGDFGGEIEVLAPNDSMIYQNRFALRHYPPTLMPNPSKWQTFNVRNSGKGTYRIRLTQERPGRANIYIYQGPFWLRMLLIPLGAALIVLFLNFTFAPKTTPSSD